MLLQRYEGAWGKDPVYVGDHTDSRGDNTAPWATREAWHGSRWRRTMGHVEAWIGTMLVLGSFLCAGAQAQERFGVGPTSRPGPLPLPQLEERPSKPPPG